MGERLQPCRVPNTGRDGCVDRAPCVKHERLARISRRYAATKTSVTTRRCMLLQACNIEFVFSRSRSVQNGVCRLRLRSARRVAHLNSAHWSRYLKPVPSRLPSCERVFLGRLRCAAWIIDAATNLRGVVACVVAAKLRRLRRRVVSLVYFVVVVPPSSVAEVLSPLMRWIPSTSSFFVVVDVVLVAIVVRCFVWLVCCRNGLPSALFVGWLSGRRVCCRVRPSVAALRCVASRRRLCCRAQPSVADRPSAFLRRRGRRSRHKRGVFVGVVVFADGVSSCSPRPCRSPRNAWRWQHCSSRCGMLSASESSRSCVMSSVPLPAVWLQHH